MFLSRFIIKLSKFATLTRLMVCLLAYSFLLSPVGRAQNPTPTQTEPPHQDRPEVLRVYTELVQTDVMVFDKQGHFVNGLKSSDFELRIDGKPKQVDFFEKITAGSISEEAQIAAARGRTTSRPEASKSGAPAPLDRGRPIFFYVDDLHLDLPSLNTTKKLIERFIENEMGQNDEAAIASASGQIGFLQQLTDDKTVLRAALERLKLRPRTVRDFDRPAMTEYQALLITNYDRDVIDYFIGQTIRQNPGTPRDVAENMVNARAQALSQQAGQVTANTLTGLEGLIRGAKDLPGRKLVFFLSGGFFLDDRNSDSRDRLQRVTSAAARSGVVIYSMDARGLVASLADISSDSGFDPSGRLANANSGELIASQDSLNALAADTGGKAIFNTNSLEPSLGRVLKETSTYYLLAWKPDSESQTASKFRHIEVKVVGKPDLKVQVRRGFFDREPEPAIAKASKASGSEKADKSKNQSEPVNLSEAELRKVILAPYPDRDLPVSLSLSYINTPDRGPLLSSALQVPNEFLSFEAVNGKPTAVVTVAGTVFDEKGNPGASFKNHLTIEAPSLESVKKGRDLAYGYPVYLGPGLYQVRVGVRDEKSGRAGSAHGWIEIPNLSSGQLALSSLVLGVRTGSAITNASTATGSVLDSVDMSVAHNFSPNGYLRFLVVAYNAKLAPADSKPDVAIQVQLVRDDQPVVTTALKKLSVEGLADLTRIPYAAEISLDGLPAGRYVLHVTAVDRVGKKSASQQTRFDIE
jgi:VWFA-related protein